MPASPPSAPFLPAGYEVFPPEYPVMDQSDSGAIRVDTAAVGALWRMWHNARANGEKDTH